MIVPHIRTAQQLEGARGRKGASRSAGLTASLKSQSTDVGGACPLASGMAGFVSPSDVVNLILAISAAVETVQGNREECRVIADRVNRIHHALNQGNSKESSEALHGLHQTLREILVFLNKFKDAGYFRRFLNRNTGEF